ncbi:MAG: hypothetical protein Q7W16_04965 [Coriobacteriia bacterium]|nr:hypothetical protein [Coriobacteriia bacterium]
MSRRTRIAAATVMMAALLFAGTAAVRAVARPAGRVVIVLAPYLTWDDIMNGPMPSTKAAAEEGLIADLNVRSGSAGAGGPSLERGALLLSAGASVLTDPGALGAYSAAETVDGTPASELYRRIRGEDPSGADTFYLGAPRQTLTNRRAVSDAMIGSLGEAVTAAGGVTAAIGNSDPGRGIRSDLQSRPAAIVAADVRGIVARGDVSASMLVTDSGAPYGVRTDVGGLLARYDRLVTGLDAGRPALVVLDTGDLARAYAWSSNATTSTAAAQHRAALETVDRVVGEVASGLGERDLLVVLAPVVPEEPDLPSSFAPLVMRGAGLTGLARTASTHRVGICTVMDVSVTALKALGITIPSAMVGSPIGGAGDGLALADRMETVVRMNDTSVAVEQVRADAVNWFITFTVVVLLASTLLLIRGAPDAPRPVWALARAALVLAPCIPLAGLVQFAVWSRPPSAIWVVALLVGTCLALWGCALLLGRHRAATVPLIAVTGATTVVLVVDQWLGAPLSFAGLFGYAPLFGARYYGLGNEMAGLLLGSAMVCCALVLDTWRDAGWTGAVKRWGWPVTGVIVLGTTAAPFLGANIGAVAWMTVGFGVGWLMLNGRRVWTWRNAAAVLVVIVVLVGALGAIDVLGGSGSETHLGRAISNATGEGGVASFMTIVARKAETNLRVLGRTNWTWLLVAVLLLLGYMRWRPRGEFAHMLRNHPAFSAILGAALFAGVIGNFTEDSGVIIPALIMLPVGVTALYLMLDGSPRKPGEGS